MVQDELAAHLTNTPVGENYATLPLGGQPTPFAQMQFLNLNNNFRVFHSCFCSIVYRSYAGQTRASKLSPSLLHRPNPYSCSADLSGPLQRPKKHSYDIHTSSCGEIDPRADPTVGSTSHDGFPSHFLVLATLQPRWKGSRGDTATLDNIRR